MSGLNLITAKIAIKEEGSGVSVTCSAFRPGPARPDLGDR
jgi:hypothetical protein